MIAPLSSSLCASASSASLCSVMSVSTVITPYGRSSPSRKSGSELKTTHIMPLGLGTPSVMLK